MHFNVVCTDLERSIEFYCDKLGGRADRDRKEALEIRREPNEAVGSALGLGEPAQWIGCFIRFSDDENTTVIDLLQWLKPPSYGKPYESANHIGIPRVALAVDDIDKMYNDLKAKGVEFITPPREVVLNLPGAAPIKIAVCKDPDGTLIEFVQGSIEVEAK